MKLFYLVGLAILLVLALVLVFPLMGQESDVIVLDNTTPGIDVQVSLPPDTSGVISLELKYAAVTVTNSIGSVVFQMADPRVHAVELRFAPNTGTHTLSIERLPGLSEAYVSLNALTDLSDTGIGMLVSDGAIGLAQEHDVLLSADTPSELVDVAIPMGNEGIITTTFPGASVTAQLVTGDATIANLAGSSIDGVSLVMEGGDYQFLVLNNNPAQPVFGNVRAMPVPAGGLGTALAELEPEPSQDVLVETSQNVNAVVVTCSATVATSSINMRSGPGTGYSVLDYGYRGESFLAGGLNADGRWLLVGTDSGSAWMAKNYLNLDGACNDLTVYDIPYRDAPQPQTIIVTPEPQIVYQEVSVPVSSSGGGGSSGSSGGGGGGGESSWDDDDDGNESSGS